MPAHRLDDRFGHPSGEGIAPAFVHDLHQEVLAGDPEQVHDAVLRPAGAAGAAGAALEVWRAARIAAGEPPSPNRIARVRVKLEDPSSHLVLAERAGRVVGMALAEQFRAERGHGAEVAGWGHVSMVFVDPESQGRGVGRELLERLGDEGPWANLSLWTRRSNHRAQALYQGRGFVPTRELGLTPAGATTERWHRAACSPTC